MPDDIDPNDLLFNSLCVIVSIIACWVLIVSMYFLKGG